jgi:cell wall-associated NlpC family hydrolase
MSISAVESRISQIVAMQQQLSDPAALASAQNSSATSSATGGVSASPASASTSTSFSEALSSALASGTESAIGGGNSADTTGATAGYSDPSMDSTPMSSDPSSALSALLATNGASAATGASGMVGASGVAGATGLTGATTGISADAPAQVQAMVNEADSLIGKPYIYGGGHSGWGPQAGYDCSGFVSAVLHAGGYLSAPQNTQTLPGQPGIEPGPGQYVTIYDRNTGPTNNEHVIIEINGQFYESGGGAGAWGGGGGVEKIGTPSQAYLSSFTTLLHPAGL